MLTCINMPHAPLSLSSVQAARRETILGATRGGNGRDCQYRVGEKACSELFIYSNNSVTCLDMIFSLLLLLSVDKCWYPLEGLHPCSHAITGSMEKGCSNKETNMETRDGSLHG